MGNLYNSTRCEGDKSQSAPQRLKDKVTELDGKVKSAQERDDKRNELKKVHGIEATPAAADSGLTTVKAVLGWFHIHDLSDETYSRILALWDTGLMQLLCLFGPHGAFLFLFGALAPDAAHRRRMKEATEKSAQDAERAARRATKNAIWGRYRRRLEASVKARFAKKAPPIVSEPEPVLESQAAPKRPFEFGADMDGVEDDENFETAAEPPLKVVSEAPEPVVCEDKTVNAIINSGLQRDKRQRVTTKQFYEKVWKPWHEDRGYDPGKQTGMTNRLKATGVLEMFKSGRDTWIADWSIRAKNERPRFRVVN